MTRLKMSLFGGFHVTLDGATLTSFRSTKTRALLAYLAVQRGQPQQRSTLATLFWGNYEDQAARKSLRNALSNLNRLLAPLKSPKEAGSPLIITRESVRFEACEPLCWVDVGVFDALLAACEVHEHRVLAQCADCIERLDKAVKLYGGDLLAGLVLSGSPGFDEWRLLQGESRHRRVLASHDVLTSHYMAHQEYGRAESSTRRRIALEPWGEQAHQQLMRILAMQRRRSAALQQYEICRQVLSQELGVEPAAEIRALYERIRGGQDLSLASFLPTAQPRPPNPYKGLQAFGEQDAMDFFGREALVERMAEAVHRQPVVVVIGPSGSGKSSLVRGGMLPLLRQHPRSTAADVDPETNVRWLIAALHPGSDPFQALASVLLPLVEPQLSTAVPALRARTRTMARSLERGELALGAVVDRILRQARQRHPENYRLLLVIDRLEDVFTPEIDAKTRRAFLELLLQASDSSVAPRDGPGQLSGPSQPQSAAPLTLLFVLRADFMGQVLSYRPMAYALQDASLVVGPMNRRELQAAITKPASRLGVFLQEGLAARIVSDFGGTPGNLPMMELALTLMWEHQDEGQLTHAAYEAVVLQEGAMTRYADDVYERLSVAEQEVARRILLRLVSPGHGTEDTSRLITRAEIGEEDWPLVQRLADARLLTTDLDPIGQETVELIHEALIQGWERLRGWLDRDQAFRQWEQRLRAGIRQWEASNRDTGSLLRGASLSEAEGWYRIRSVDLGPIAREFLNASLVPRKHVQLAVDVQRQQRMEQARLVADSVRRQDPAERLLEHE